MLAKRVASAAIIIPLVAIVVYRGGLLFCIAVALVGLLAGYEFFKIVRLNGHAPSYPLGLSLIALFVANAQWPEMEPLRWGMGLVLLATLAVEVFHRNAPGSLTNWALTIAGGVYIGFTISYFIRLRGTDEGLLWVILALLSTWISDTGAYFVGSVWGKRPLAPHISPRKTWEGALGGLITSIASVVPLGYFLLDLKVGWGLTLGVLVFLAATLGDLSESMIKRQVGVKDSSNLIPGHGGALDRMDSLLFVIPVVYFFVTAVNLLSI
ncbi:MAG: hypothetical protein A2Y73_01425 [Chloroflexi bacterium RBG_13_56_8]|nr:MAG: hypothetical protein A2Y73_01425 [Chloroflexi bacterium RBG_13_56_8]